MVFGGIQGGDNMKLSNIITVLAIAGVAVVSMITLDVEAKDIVIAATAGLVGYLTNNIQ